jgi:D-alanine-D-alanine ligase-like ATP-grasp enzyme
MTRIDHMWDADVEGKDALVTIEVNTVPGFSEASILPKMLAAAGIPPQSLLNGLIEEMLHRSKEG